MFPYVFYQTQADFEAAKHHSSLSKSRQLLSDKAAQRLVATQREKKRQMKINDQIHTLRRMVCPTEPPVKEPTKGTVLKRTVERLKYLEELHKQLKNKETQLLLAEKEGRKNSKSDSKILAKIKRTYTEIHHLYWLDGEVE